MTFTEQKSTNSVASVALCLVSGVTEDAPLPGLCLERREDSPVVRSSRPKPSSCSDNDGTVITFRMLCRFVFSVYRCCVDVCVCVSGWRRESKLSVCGMKSLSVPHRNECISLGFGTVYKLRAASFPFCLQHSVLVTFSRAQVFLFVLWL